MILQFASLWNMFRYHGFKYFSPFTIKHFSSPMCQSSLPPLFPCLLLYYFIIKHVGEDQQSIVSQSFLIFFVHYLIHTNKWKESSFTSKKKYKKGGGGGGWKIQSWVILSILPIIFLIHLNLQDKRNNRVPFPSQYSYLPSKGPNIQRGYRRSCC